MQQHCQTFFHLITKVHFRNFSFQHIYLDVFQAATTSFLKGYKSLARGSPQGSSSFCQQFSPKASVTCFKAFVVAVPQFQVLR